MCVLTVTWTIDGLFEQSHVIPFKVFLESSPPLLDVRIDHLQLAALLQLLMVRIRPSLHLQVLLDLIPGDKLSGSAVETA